VTVRATPSSWLSIPPPGTSTIASTRRCPAATSTRSRNMALACMSRRVPHDRRCGPRGSRRARCRDGELRCRFRAAAAVSRKIRNPHREARREARSGDVPVPLDEPLADGPAPRPPRRGPSLRHRRPGIPVRPPRHSARHSAALKLAEVGPAGLRSAWDTRRVAGERRG
jgi:hypothetical protein